MKKANPTAVGAFVLGAAALVIVGVLVLGSGTLFRDTQRFVLFPEGSVNGLTAGSRVKVRGVEIGSVLEVNALSDDQRGIILSEIVIEIDPARFKLVGAATQTAQRAKELVDNGLRARLEVASLITGQLYVGFDFYPDQPVELKGIASPYPELPMVPSLTEEVGSSLRHLMERLRELPLERIAQNLDGALAGLNTLANSPDLKAAITEMDEALGEIRGAAAEARTTLAEARQTLAGASKLVDDVDAQVGPVVESAAGVLDQVRSTLATVEGVVEPGAEVRYELTQALVDLGEAARAIRRLADYVERNPNSIVFGRTSKGEQ